MCGVSAAQSVADHALVREAAARERERQRALRSESWDHAERWPLAHACRLCFRDLLVYPNDTAHPCGCDCHLRRRAILETRKLLAEQPNPGELRGWFYQPMAPEHRARIDATMDEMGLSPRGRETYVGLYVDAMAARKAGDD